MAHPEVPISLFLALAASSLVHASDTDLERRNLNEELRHLRVDLPSGQLTATLDASLSKAEFRLRKVSWGEGCKYTVEGNIRTRIVVDEPALSSVVCTVEVDLQLPAGVAVSLMVDEGAVVLDGLTSDARVRIDEGALTLTDVRGGVSVKMKSGTVSGTHLGETIDVTLTNEGLELEGEPPVVDDSDDSDDSTDSTEDDS